ncbi:histone H2B [Ditylenchus destructor]|uniref:Histone H2B n=1 Tax=Ditylenchus destructor TaxID=166010 RepID=A0AAD4QU74_9BILA|nr:histone H2B [Ditylenchus destructor]
MQHSVIIYSQAPKGPKGVLRCVHLSHSEAGASGHWHLVESDVDYELVRQRRFRAHRGGGFSNRPVQNPNLREIQTLVRLILPGELAKHAVTEGAKALTKYTSSQ